MKKLMSVVVLVGVLLIGALTAQAQDKLTVGDAIIGNLSADTPQVEYTYTATAGEILVLELYAVDFSVFSDLALIVNDSTGTELVRDETFGVSAVYFQFAEAGDYTIIAARSEYADADAAGEYSLRAVTPTELTLGTPVEVTKKMDEGNYYLYTGADDANLVFAKNGELTLDVTVNRLSEYVTGSLDELAKLGGELVTQGTLGVIPGGDTYIIVVSDVLFSFASDDAEATYTLGLEAPKS